MAVSKDIEAKILRYHFVEKWRTGTIATQLGIHYSVVDRILAHAGLPKIERALRPSIMDPYLPFIVETLNQFPKLTAARLYEMHANVAMAVGKVCFASASASLDHVNSQRLICA